MFAQEAIEYKKPPKEIYDLVNAKPGVNINTDLSSDAKTVAFEGKVISAVSKYDDKVQTVVIRSTNYNGATLSISKVTGDDGTIKYNGLLMSFQAGDLYVLKQKDDGFVLLKKSFYDVVNE